MKIAIIGGGISGLSTYLNLQKHVVQNPQLEESISITIYETHDLQHLGDKQPTEIPSIGGGYGIAPNGMASLRRLDPDIHDEILRNGFPAAKTWMKSARGWTLGVMAFFDGRGEHPECCTMILREVAIQSLYKRVSTSDLVQHKVVEVTDGEDDVCVKLDNGNEERYDLVIGADGVWSKTRTALIGDAHPPEYRQDPPIVAPKTRLTSLDRGLFTVGGFVSTDFLPSPPQSGEAAHAQTVMTFGPNGFFAYTPYLTGDVKATDKHILGEATLPPGKMAFWWSRSEQKDPKADPDEQKLKKDLEQRYESWKDPAIKSILQNSEVKLKIPTFVLPKIPTWTGRRIVLIGDAAHALPSSSGQGVSQSLEDAEALALLLAFNLDRSKTHVSESEILAQTFREYMSVRKLHVEKVLDMGNKAGDTSRDLNVAGELLMYGAMWLAFKLFGTFFLKTIVDYDVIAEVEKITKQE